MELIFASNNKGKIIEIQSLISNDIKVITLGEAGILDVIEEPYDTFQENAWAKADYIYRKTGKDCIAEDSGLVVPQLGGAPGVYSARYAGEPSNDQLNNDKLLKSIEKLDQPEAFYQSVICLMLQGTAHYFEGKCSGHLIHSPRGEGGFGYDPLFVPQGYAATFAELPLAEKNKISHRSFAMQQFSAFINQHEIR